MGCGDFEVGKNLIPYIHEYIAADVSQLIIEQNKKIFADTGVKFIHFDGSKNEMIQADIVIIRQVLQHLSNGDIEKILENIKKSGAKYLCITEHLPYEKGFTPNIDKPSGVGIRLGLGSGICIEEHPFKFPSKSIKVLLNIETKAEGLKSFLQTKLYTL